MNRSLKEKYAARVQELESLGRELAAGRRPGDPAPLVGRVLEAAGDLLRRRAAVPCPAGTVEKVLTLVPEPGLSSWASGVDEKSHATRLAQAAGQAVESAIPDSDDEGRVLAGYAMDALLARDRLESALVALEALAKAGRGDARVLAERLRPLAARIDAMCRKSGPSFTPLNTERRGEAQLLDEPYRVGAWWFVEKSGPEHDGLVATFGGVPRSTLGPAEQAAAREVDAPRDRPVTYDELFRFDLGLASPAEAAAIRREAERDAEMKTILSALDAGERAIEELTSTDVPPTPRAAAPGTPVEPKDAPPEQLAERAEFKLLVFRAKARLQVVVQPRPGQQRIAASLEVPEVFERPERAQPGPLGLVVDLGDPARFRGKRAIARVTLDSGAVVTLEAVL